MAFREDDRVTPAERASFELVPETCPEIEKALDKMRVGPSLELIKAELESYGVEYTDNLRFAIHAICAKATNMAAHEVRQTVLLRGTFPLRLALVQQLEKTLPGPHPESRYARWLRT